MFHTRQVHERIGSYFSKRRPVTHFFSGTRYTADKSLVGSRSMLSVYVRLPVTKYARSSAQRSADEGECSHIRTKRRTCDVLYLALSTAKAFAGVEKTKKKSGWTVRGCCIRVIRAPSRQRKRCKTGLGTYSSTSLTSFLFLRVYLFFFFFFFFVLDYLRGAIVVGVFATVLSRLCSRGLSGRTTVTTA